jgi:hypothetical protein
MNKDLGFTNWETISVPKFPLELNILLLERLIRLTNSFLQMHTSILHRLCRNSQEILMTLLIPQIRTIRLVIIAVSRSDHFARHSRSYVVTSCASFATATFLIVHSSFNALLKTFRSNQTVLFLQSN